VQTLSKTYIGRKVREEKVFTGSPKMVFGALYEATAWLNKQGYTEGSLDYPNPIGFTQGSYRSYDLHWKWHNLSREDKKKLSGVIMSDDWRHGNVKVIFLED
jgi:hypothetical protein